VWSSESELHIFHVMSHFHLIILFAPNEASATATRKIELNCDNKQSSHHLPFPIQNMLRLSSFSFTATAAEMRPKHTMSWYVGAPVQA
jgi:hypothetical protein